MNTIDEYIETFEPNIQKTLNEIWNFIKMKFRQHQRPKNGQVTALN